MTDCSKQGSAKPKLIVIPNGMSLPDKGLMELLDVMDRDGWAKKPEGGGLRMPPLPRIGLWSLIALATVASVTLRMAIYGTP